MSDESVSFLLTQDMKEIFESYLDTKMLNCFSHSRVFPDGSRAELWTDKEAMRHTHVLKRYISSVSHAPSIYDEKERYVFLEDKIESSFRGKIKENYVNQVKEQREMFNHDSTFIVFNKTELCHELYCFFGPKEEKRTKAYVINHLTDIETFITEYNQKAKHMIKRAEEDRLVKPWIKTNQVISPNLTLLERDVGQLASNALTDIEVANYLGKSVRTIQGYMTKLKDKYLVFSKHDLILRLRVDPKLFEKDT